MSKYSEAMEAYIDEVLSHHNNQCDKCKKEFVSDDKSFLNNRNDAYVKHTHWTDENSSLIKIKLSKKLGKKELIKEYGLLCPMCCHNWKFGRSGINNQPFEEWLKETDEQSE